MAFLANCRATGIGSLPIPDVRSAVEAVFDTAPDLPYLPKLPKVSKNEGMNEQALEGFPGLVVEDGKLRHVQDEAFFLGVERLFAAYETGDDGAAALSPEYAHALEPFLAEIRARGTPEAKAQISGPVTVGMAVLGQDGKPILYDAVVRDALTKHLYLRAKWQARAIAEAGARPVIFVDEPVLAQFGTPFFGWGIDQVRAVLEAVAEGAETVGSHCCSNTEWSIFLESRLDVVSFDAFGFADNFLVYRDDVAAFIERGGTIAWGIVPTDPEDLAGETLESLRARLVGLVARVEALGFERERVLAQSLVTPACGLGSRPSEPAARAIGLARDLAANLRREYLGL